MQKDLNNTVGRQSEPFKNIDATTTTYVSGIGADFDDKLIYWFNFASASDLSTGTLYQAPYSGNANLTQVIAKDVATPSGLIVDDNDILWLTGVSTVTLYNLKTRATSTPATGFAAASGFDVQDKFLYVVDGTNGVYVVPSEEGVYAAPRLLDGAKRSGLKTIAVYSNAIQMVASVLFSGLAFLAAIMF